MILKYAYSYSNPNGTFYVGYPTGVNTHVMSANVMSTLAQQHGSVLVEVRRLIKEKLGNARFELVNVTPQRITDQGIMHPEDIKGLYELVKFDEGLQKAVDLVAKQLHDDMVEVANQSFDPQKAIRDYLTRLFVPEIKIETKINGNMIDVTLTIPRSYVTVDLELKSGALNGSKNRS